MSKIANTSNVKDFVPRIGTGVVASRSDQNGKDVFRENRLRTLPYHTNKMGVPIRMAKADAKSDDIRLLTR